MKKRVFLVLSVIIVFAIMLLHISCNTKDVEQTQQSEMNYISDCASLELMISDNESIDKPVDETAVESVNEAEKPVEEQVSSEEQTEESIQENENTLSSLEQLETNDELTEEPIDNSLNEPFDESAGEVFYSASEFKVIGVIRWNGWRWTWYSEKVLPGGGLKIPGRHNDDNGYVCDENDYICVASSTLSKGTIIDTPLGKKGKVYDTGCAADVIDVYVSW